MINHFILGSTNFTNFFLYVSCRTRIIPVRKKQKELKNNKYPLILIIIG